MRGHISHLTPLQQIATLASLYTYHDKGYIYPKEKIDISWEKVLLNQCEYLQELVKFSKLILLSLQSMMVNLKFRSLNISEMIDPTQSSLGHQCMFHSAVYFSQLIK